ncbi:MAG: 30S ribosomal protein S3 [Pyrodictiaceae archaeon]
MVLIKKYFVKTAMLQAKIDEFLAKKYYRAGYAGVKIIRFPLGTRVFIDAERPAMIIGSRGEGIRRLARILENYFGLQNPQITVRRVENPDLNARVVASRIAVLMEKGAFHRRVAAVMLRRIINAGAIGAQIVISGKLRTERARYEKLRWGKVYSTGHHVEYIVDRAVMHVLLKPGVYGIEVTIVKPGRTADYVRIKEPEEVKEFIEEVRESLEQKALQQVGEAGQAQGEGGEAAS